MDKIRILLADDHNVLREGLRALLERQPDFEVVAEAENGHQAVALCRQLHPDVVLMDIGMPLLNGLEATEQIMRAGRCTQTVEQGDVAPLFGIIHVRRENGLSCLQASAQRVTLAKQAIRIGPPGNTSKDP